MFSREYQLTLLTCDRKGESFICGRRNFMQIFVTSNENANVGFKSHFQFAVVIFQLQLPTNSEGVCDFSMINYHSNLVKSNELSGRRFCALVLDKVSELSTHDRLLSVLRG